MANVSNPYSFNITSNKSFSGSCPANNSFTLTVGTYLQDVDTGDEDYNYTEYFYGYSVVGWPFGKLSPNTYKGSTILNFYETEGNGYDFVVSFSGNSINKIGTTLTIMLPNSEKIFLKYSTYYSDANMTSYRPGNIYKQYLWQYRNSSITVKIDS